MPTPYRPPTPVPPPPPPQPVTPDPSITYWQFPYQNHAVVQVRQHHCEALYRYGEYAMFLLRWDYDDFAAGLVDLCAECVTDFDPISNTFNQPAKNKCVSCFGTRYEGGIKARLIRPCLWDANEEVDDFHARGEVEVATSTIQSTNDFRMRKGDWVFRADGTRHRVQSLSTERLKTGYEHSSRPRTSIGFNYGRVQKEDASTVAFIIPPTDPAEIVGILDVVDHWPLDFTAHEQIDGPVIY